MDVEMGYNEEEMKMVKETRKIWKYPNVSGASLGSACCIQGVVCPIRGAR